MPFIIVTLFVVACIAFALSAICGGGASFILLPVLSWILPGAQVPAALSIGTAASSISRMVIFFRNIRWDIVLWFVPPALPAVWFGAKLLSSTDPVLLELFIGFFLVVNLPFIFKPAVAKTTVSRRPKWILSLIGLATGFLSGLTGAVGLLFNRFYLTYGMTKEEIVATRAANELVLHVIKIVLYGLFGLLTIKAVTMGLVISLAAIVSAWLMKRLLKFFTERSFQRIGFTAMVLSGIVMMVNSGFTLHKEKQLAIKINTADHKMETKIKWKETSFAMEFAFDEGFEMERVIQLADLPKADQERVNRMVIGADRVLLEEVYSYRKHYYEVYIYKNGKLNKYNLH